MTADMEVQSFDFRKPCRLSVAAESRVLTWQGATCRLAADKLSEHLPFETQWQALPPETANLSETTLPAHLATFRVKLPGDATTVLGIPAPLALELVQGMMGITSEQREASRRLTAIETSLLEIAVQVFLEAVAEAAGRFQFPSGTLAGFEPDPKIIRLFPGDGDIVTQRFQVTLPSGPHELVWIWPGDTADEILGEEPSLAGDGSDANASLLDVARRIPLELRVQLGSAQLDVADLASLTVGDVIVLDQRVFAPLDCFLDGNLIFHVWPGACGNRQAIQVQSLVE